MLGPDDLVLCSGTLIRASFRERVEAAVAGGYQAISLWPKDYHDARSAGLSNADIKALLADNGLEIAELDPLLSWIPGEKLGPDASPAEKAFLGVTEVDFYEIADAVGGRCLNIAQGFGSKIELEPVVEAFAGLCDRAAEHDLDVCLEFLPWSGIPDAAKALEVVEKADRPNGGIMLDTWHHFRGTYDHDQLRALPGVRLKGIQISDAPMQAWDALPAESMQARLVPGEGDIELVEILRIVRAIGSQAPVGVEVFSKDLDALPPSEAAARCADATRSLLAKL